jgi:uncharacterized membrane protein (UPF0127 family)
MRSGWLLRDGDVVCALQIADAPGERWQGFEGHDGAVHTQCSRLVHTMGAAFPLDMAFLDGELAVLAVASVAPRRLLLSRPGTRSVVQARAGSWERWNVGVGDRLEIREVR